jgi:hypothetical protein
MDKINIEESKRLSRILAGSEKPKDKAAEKLSIVQAKMNQKIRYQGLDPNDPFAKDIYLFAFKGKFHKIMAKKHTILTTDKAVQALLTDYPETKLYYLCTNSGMCPMPLSFSGKDAKAAQLKDDNAVIAFIQKLTGVAIRVSQL